MATLSKYNFLAPYKLDIQQGNDLTEATIDKLHVGMTRAQVQFVMGATVLTDIYHPNRWDYVYSMRNDGVLVSERRVTLFFTDDKLDRIERHMGDAAAPVAPVKSKG